MTKKRCFNEKKNPNRNLYYSNTNNITISNGYLNRTQLLWCASSLTLVIDVCDSQGPRPTCRIRISKHTLSSLIRMATSWSCIIRREFAHAAHIGHHMLPFPSLLKSHGMNATRPTPRPRWNLQAYRHREGGTEPFGSITRRKVDLAHERGRIRWCKFDMEMVPCTNTNHNILRLPLLNDHR